MRKRILAAAATLALGVAVAGTWLDVASAQPAPAAPGAAAAPADATPPGPPRGGPDGGPPWMRMMAAHMPWGRGPGGPGGPGGPHGLTERMRNWGLLFTPADRQLTTQDVQKIAEAFLLWHGNHSWKVTEVTQNSDGKIGFALATSDGGVIARFTMDSHTGRVERNG